MRPADSFYKLQLVDAFFNGIELISLHLAEGLPGAARPLNFNQISRGGRSQAEASPKITLRKVTPATCDLTHLGDASSLQANARAHRIPVAFSPNQLQIQEMVSSAAVVVQQQWRVTVIGDHQINEAVIIEVAKSRSPRGMRGQRPDSTRLRHFDK